MAARVEDDSLALSDVNIPQVEKTPQDTSNSQYTTERLLNMKPDTKKTTRVPVNGISNGTAKDTKQAPVKTPAETFTFPMPIITFAPGLGPKEKEPSEEENGGDMHKNQVPDKGDLPSEKSTEDKTKKKKKKKKPAPTGFEGNVD